jgi:hypothetical protein
MSDGIYDLDRIFRELMETRQKLDSLPPDASTERARLERRRQELHELATNLQASVGDERPTPEIQTELASLKVSLTEIEDATIDIAVQHGGSALEASYAPATMDLNRAIESGQGADEIRVRIRQLEDTLEKRGVALN